jgi:hypothetical protein
MDLKGYSAWISVDGAALKEYNVEVSNGKNATCWIASEAGKASHSYHTHALLRQAYGETSPNIQKFTVNWRDSDRSSMISGFVKLDGIACGGHTISPALPGMPLTPVTAQKSAVPTSVMTEKPFLFSPLELTGIGLVSLIQYLLFLTPRFYFRRRFILGPACGGEQSR